MRSGVGRLDAERPAAGRSVCGKLNEAAGPGDSVVAQPVAKRLELGCGGRRLRLGLLQSDLGGPGNRW